MMPYFELADPKRFTQHAVKYFCGKYPQIKKKQVASPLSRPRTGAGRILH